VIGRQSAEIEGPEVGAENRRGPFEWGELQGQG
jgi:hypothetical protein